MRTKPDARPGSLPLVLVHGYLSTAEMLAPLAARLRARGFDVHSADLSPLCIQDVRQLAVELGASIDRVLERTGAAQCQLVGLSQGGIIALYYAKFLDTGARVARLVAAGAPFQGSWAPIAGLLATPWLGVVSRGVWQVMPNSQLLNELHNAPTPPHVRLSTVAVQGDLVAMPDRCRLPGVKHTVVGGVPFVAHQWLIFSPQVAEAVANDLLAE
jgi:pimeloyl-ACP methyl ester carboxylesterase